MIYIRHHTGQAIRTFKEVHNAFLAGDEFEVTASGQPVTIESFIAGTTVRILYGNNYLRNHDITITQEQLNGAANKGFKDS